MTREVVQSSRTGGRPRLRKGRLTEILREKVHEGHYQPGSILESERTIGQKYGVSRFTVRAALQALEGEGLINRQAGRGAVVTRPANLDHVPGSSSTDVRKSVVFVRISASAPLATMISGARRFCSEDNAEFIVVDAGGSHETGIRYLNALPANVNGVILCPFDSADYHLAMERLQAKGIAVVCLEHTIDGGALPSVEPDAFAGSYKATSQLLEHWPGPVFYIGCPNPSASTIRQQGWHSAMADHGFIDTDMYCHHISDVEILGPAGYEAFLEPAHKMSLELLKTEPSTGEGWSIFCGSDLFALGLYQAARERGLAIGSDVRIAGYGNYPFAKRLDPPLTSVVVPHSEIGYIAAKLLCEQIAGHSSHPMRRVLPVELIERASSTAKPLVSDSIGTAREKRLSV